MAPKKDKKECRPNEFNPSRFLLGLLIVFFGFVVLAKNAGWLSRYYYIDLGSIWPVLIILAGVSLLRFKSWWANALLFIFTLVVFIAIVGITLTGGKGLEKKDSGGGAAPMINLDALYELKARS